MKRSTSFQFFALFLCLATIAFIVGCGSNATSSSGGAAAHGTYAYQGTQSSGDAYSWTIGNGTFVGTNDSEGITIEGSWVDLSSGFKLATVEFSSDIVAIPLNSNAFFLEFPNTALMIKPAGGEDNVIVCAAKAASVPTDSKFNFVQLPWVGWRISDTAYGTAEQIGTGPSSYQFRVATYNTYGTPEVLSNPFTTSTYTFTEGAFDPASVDPIICVAPSGVFASDNGENGGFVGAVAQTGITSFDVAAAGMSYRGCLFKYNPATGTGETEPIGTDPYPGRTGWLRGYSWVGGNIINGNIDYDNGVSIEFTSDNGNGIFNCNTTMPNGAGGQGVSPMVITIAKVNGKYMAYGITRDISTGWPQNFLLIQQ